MFRFALAFGVVYACLGFELKLPGVEIVGGVFAKDCVAGLDFLGVVVSVSMTGCSGTSAFKSLADASKSASSMSISESPAMIAMHKKNQILWGDKWAICCKKWLEEWLE